MPQDPIDSRNIQRTQAFLRLQLLGGLGLHAAHRLLEEIEDPLNILSLTARELTGRSLPPRVAEELLSVRARQRAENEWNQAHALGIRIIDIRDPTYPRLLLETFDPPLVLYLRSNLWDPERPHLAIVGARDASTYGANCARQLARDLAERGFVIVSGLARGIDTAAHRGALMGGHTVAVCGTGLDIVYPQENRRLADSIVANGALLSEFPLGTPPFRKNFPMRNRVLAGMTLGTVVVEASERSGSLITARLALEANREVFAVPGPIFSQKSYGPHSLIRQGGCLITNWIDVVEELGIAIPSKCTHDNIVQTEPSGLTDPQRRVRDALSASEETPIDTLLATLDLAPGKIYSALLELELSGIVQQLPGDRYALRLP